MAHWLVGHVVELLGVGRALSNQRRHYPGWPNLEKIDRCHRHRRRIEAYALGDRRSLEEPM